MIAQTEGDGYARGYASLALEQLFSRKLGIEPREVFERIPMLMIGGTAGLMYPHFTLFTRSKTGQAGDAKRKRLAIGVSSTRRLLPEEYGTLVELDAVAEATAQAMRDAGIADPRDVHSVQMKTPSMTPARVEDAKSRGKEVCNPNLVTASGMTRGAAALGAGVALGEIDRKRITEKTIGGDASVYTDCRLRIGRRRAAFGPRDRHRQRARGARESGRRARHDEAPARPRRRLRRLPERRSRGRRRAPHRGLARSG